MSINFGKLDPAGTRFDPRHHTGGVRKDGSWCSRSVPRKFEPGDLDAAGVPLDRARHYPRLHLRTSTWMLIVARDAAGVPFDPEVHAADEFDDAGGWRSLVPTREPFPLTEYILQVVSATITEQGSPRGTAFSRVGIPRVRWSQWIRSGEEQLRRGNCDDLPARLVLAIEIAEANVHDRIFSQVMASPELKAKIWFLEKRFPNLYKPEQPEQATVPVGAPVDETPADAAGSILLRKIMRLKASEAK